MSNRKITRESKSVAPRPYPPTGREGQNAHYPGFQPPRKALPNSQLNDLLFTPVLSSQDVPSYAYPNPLLSTVPNYGAKGAYGALTTQNYPLNQTSFAPPHEVQQSNIFAPSNSAYSEGLTQSNSLFMQPNPNLTNPHPAAQQSSKVYNLPVTQDYQAIQSNQNAPSNSQPNGLLIAPILPSQGTPSYAYPNPLLSTVPNYGVKEDYGALVTQNYSLNQTSSTPPHEVQQSNIFAPSNSIVLPSQEDAFRLEQLKIKGDSLISKFFSLGINLPNINNVDALYEESKVDLIYKSQKKLTDRHKNIILKYIKNKEDRIYKFQNLIIGEYKKGELKGIPQNFFDFKKHFLNNKNVRNSELIIEYYVYNWIFLKKNKKEFIKTCVMEEYGAEETIKKYLCRIDEKMGKIN